VHAIAGSQIEAVQLPFAADEVSIKYTANKSSLAD
jgi:hypothetical protein